MFLYVKKTVVLVALCATLASSVGAEESPIRRLELADVSARETIVITKNTSQVFRFDRPIARASISNPAICDIVNVGERELLVNAKDTGVVSLMVWDQQGNVITYSLESTVDVEKLRSILRQVDSRSDLQITTFNDTVAVYGTAGTSLHLKQIQEAAKAFDKGSVSFVRLREPQQVLLEVRFAEVTRRSSEEFKLDLQGIGSLSKYATFSSLTGQTGATSAAGTSSYGAPSGVLFEGLPSAMGAQQFGNFAASYINSSQRLTSYLNWLEQKNVLKIIARPNLIAKDGEEAKFIVGGEFPIPLATRDGIEINYKEFGTQLKFTPEILEDSTIRVKVMAEVSELDFTNTLTNGQFTVPSILKRNSQTITELKDNQSLVIGGLMTQKINKINRKVPLLGDIPGIGKLMFQARDFQRTDVELLIVITPHIVHPMELGEKKEFYKAQEVKEAIAPYQPSYPDAHADLIGGMMVQGEDRWDFNKQMKASQIKLEEERKKLKEINDENRRRRKQAAPDEYAVTAPAPSPSPSQDYSGTDDAAPLNRGVFPGGRLN